MPRFSKNFLKVEVSTTLLKIWYHDQHINIKSDPHTNNSYLDKKLSDNVVLNKGYVLQRAATAKGLVVMVKLFSL